MSPLFCHSPVSLGHKEHTAIPPYYTCVCTHTYVHTHGYWGTEFSWSIEGKKQVDRDGPLHSPCPSGRRYGSPRAYGSPRNLFSFSADWTSPAHACQYSENVITCDVGRSVKDTRNLSGRGHRCSVVLLGSCPLQTETYNRLCGKDTPPQNTPVFHTF